MIEVLPENDFLNLQVKRWEVHTQKIKVLLLQIYYPLSMGRYFDRALRRRDDIDLITTGPFTGSWIPWLGGMNVLDKYAIPPDIPLPFPPNVGEVNYDIVRANLPPDWHPDLIINVDAGIHWRYKPSEGYVAHVATDPHALNYDYQRTISDTFFNMQLCYSHPGDVYLPYAYDPTVHYPMDGVIHLNTDLGDNVQQVETVSHTIKDHDAVLIGMPYEQRVRWVNELRSRGVSVIFENGPIFDEYRIQNNRATIGLNWSSLNDLNARVMELQAMKLCTVMNRVPDLDKFFVDGFHYLGFSNLNEAIEKVIWAKEHPDDAKVIAERGYNNITMNLKMTYDDRVEDILKVCKFL